MTTFPSKQTSSSKKLRDCVWEAKRFIRFAEEAIDELEARKEYSEHYPSKKRAAAKRSSLDLTRSLAQLRKTS